MCEYAIDHGWKSFRGHQIFQWLYRSRVFDIDGMTNLSKDTREQLKSEFIVNPLKLIKKQLEDGEVDEILSYLDFEKMLQDKYGITITECEKYKHDIGFTRGYHITFEKYGVEIEEDIEMNGYNSIAFMQGNQRTLKEILESNLDIDSLLEEFAEQYGYLKGE